METFNGLHIPQIKNVDMVEVQSTFCNTSNVCVDDCAKCLFGIDNLNEFIIWFKSNLKDEKREGE